MADLMELMCKGLGTVRVVPHLDLFLFLCFFLREALRMLLEPFHILRGLIRPLLHVARPQPQWRKSGNVQGKAPGRTGQG